MLRVVFSFLLLINGVVCSFSEVIFEEQFNDNTAVWNLPNGFGNQSSIINGSLVWKRNADLSDVAMQYINQLNDQKDFEIESRISVKKIGSEYGIVWGGTTKGDSKFFLLKGNKYRILEASDNKIASATDYKLNFAIKADNIIKISKKGTTVNYYVNETKVYSENFKSLNGKNIGLTLWGNASISIDYIKVSGTRIPINKIAGLYYPEKPQNLGPKINSNKNEMSPIINADGTKLYFSRRTHPSNLGGATDLEDAYVSEYKNGTWSEAQNLGRPINNGGPNAVHGVSPDGNVLLLINTYDQNGKQKGQGFSFSQKTATGWSVPHDARIRGYYNKSNFNEFFLSANGKILLMAIEQEGGHGSRDIYVSYRRSDGTWNNPVSLGPIINTSGTELSPFLAADGVTLYFSSNGHPGYGKNDVFMTRRLDNTWNNWSKPQNLGEPINGKGIDSYYSVPASGEFAYFVSSDPALNTTDIYRIKLPEKVKPKPVVIIKGTVRNSKTNEPIGTAITYRDYKNDEEMGIAQSDPVTGYYEIVLPMDRVYAFFAEKKGFYSVQDLLDAKLEGGKYKEITRDLYLTPIELGQSAQLKNVLFVRSKAILKPGSYAELNKLVEMLDENRAINVEISGHTDNVGNPDLNEKLSQERAEAVKDYLVQKGIEPQRVTCKGYGGDKPIASNEREETRRLNRRVEFKILNF